MNRYQINVMNTKIYETALNEVSAMKAIGIFAAIGEMIDYVQVNGADAWIYKVELNGNMVLAYVKRVG